MLLCHDNAAMRLVHLIGDFSAPYRGAELALLDLADILESADAVVHVWSATQADPS
jgi:hypothetical protein